MGQQQLLLLVIGIVLVGQATVLGLEICENHLIQSNIDALVYDGIRIATDAQIWKSKHAIMGGGASRTYWEGLTFDQLRYPVEGDVNTYVGVNGTFLLTDQSSPELKIIARSHADSNNDNLVIITVSGTRADDINTVILAVDDADAEI